MDLIVGNIVGVIIGVTCALVYMSVSARFARLERRVDLLLKNTGVDLAKIAAEEAATLARAGNKIEAIKVYRDYTGVSLAEAKAKVEALASSAG